MVHAGTCVLEVHVSVEGDLTAEQKAAVLRVAQACPVHKTLTGDIAIDASLDPAQRLQGRALTAT